MLYRIEQCQDVFVDALVRDELSQLRFMSFYGRETATRELLARIQIGERGQDGLTELTLISEEPNGPPVSVVIATAKELEKFQGRIANTLYGPLLHTFVYHAHVKNLSRGARTGWILQPTGDDRTQAGKVALDRAWEAVKQLARVPLLDHWRDPVLSHMGSAILIEMGRQNDDVLARQSQPLGALRAWRLSLNLDFEERVSALVQTGALALEPEQQTTGDASGPKGLEAWNRWFEPTTVEQLLANGRRDRSNADHDPWPVAKLFDPAGAATWLLTSLDPEAPSCAFGLCDLGMGFPELGYVDLTELAGVRGALSLGIERDLHFQADRSISEYARLARADGRIAA